jgi:hydroxymethylpyrimidine/phosphomethylpyrimidine kinase
VLAEQSHKHNNREIAIALTIAGSDSSGGAGIQADLKTFSALGVYGASVITAITAQNTVAITDVHAIPIATVAAQIDAVLQDLDVGAIKIGMLSSPEIIETVSNAISNFNGPVVLDPVMVAKSGGALLQQNAIDSLRNHLIPRATLITPNLPEAATLLNCTQADSDSSVAEQGKALLASGANAVLMKGGHAEGDICIDQLITEESSHSLSAKRIATHCTHGTGCTLSAAIAAQLARGHSLSEAVTTAHAYLQKAIAGAERLQVGSGHGPVHHFHALWGRF